MRSACGVLLSFGFLAALSLPYDAPPAFSQQPQPPVAQPRPPVAVGGQIVPGRAVRRGPGMPLGLAVMAVPGTGKENEFTDAITLPKFKPVEA